MAKKIKVNGSELTEAIADKKEFDFETDLEAQPVYEEIREGVIKESLEDVLGLIKEEQKHTEHESTESQTGADNLHSSSNASEPFFSGSNDYIQENTTSGFQNQDDRTNSEVFAEVKAICYGFNFMVVSGSGLVASLMGKTIDTKSISASDAELTRLAKVAQPVYEKYITSAKPEHILIFTILSMYGFKIANAFVEAVPKGEKPVRPVSKKGAAAHEDNTNKPWFGDPRYFQSGQKAGQLKPLK